MYSKNMEASNLKQMEKLLLQAGTEGNALLKGLSDKHDLPKELRSSASVWASFKTRVAGLSASTDGLGERGAKQSTAASMCF